MICAGRDGGILLESWFVWACCGTGISFCGFEAATSQGPPAHTQRFLSGSVSESSPRKLKVDANPAPVIPHTGLLRPFFLASANTGPGQAHSGRQDGNQITWALPTQQFDKVPPVPVWPGGRVS